MTSNKTSGKVYAPKASARQVIEQIARQHLGFETLDERKSDSLDFRDVSVWSVEAALRAAYEAGAASVSS